MDKTLTSRGKISYQSANVAEFFWRQNTIDFASVRHRIHLKFKVSWKFQFLFLWAGIKPLKFNFMADCTFYNLIPWKARRMSTRIGSNRTNLNSFLRPYCKRLRDTDESWEFLNYAFYTANIYSQSFMPPTDSGNKPWWTLFFALKHAEGFVSYHPQWHFHFSQWPAIQKNRTPESQKSSRDKINASGNW